MMHEKLTFPATRGRCPFAPPTEVDHMRRESPVQRVTLWDGSKAWLVTGHAEVRDVLRDPTFSSEPHHPGFPWINQGLKSQNTGNVPSFIRMDGDRHARLRRILAEDFTPRRAEALRPEIQQAVHECLDHIIEQSSPVDLMTALALPVPSLIICRLLGARYEDHQFFQERAGKLLQTFAEPGELEQANHELLGYLSALADSKRAEPDHSIVSRLVSSGELADSEIARQCMFLLIAGHETTANQITMSTLALLRAPDQLAMLRAQPELIRSTVEELLRYATIVHSGAPRVATRDVRVGEEIIQSGDGVLCVLDAANHDERAFDAPGELDITRRGQPHVAFGFGTHQCLGQHLARVELHVVLETLLQRLPQLRLGVPFEQLRFKEDGAVYGVRQLPVHW
ncbi:cytochrome P450 [Pseudonocardia alaniniphila]|uniref:Cytochrome P450 n=1 Tax=Pseudonocardia alaniniphila TaxID=75291 RepID=A0ABS9TV12_9PSEU|nr:cytochrome P450 [Pseudonocardia alaniniphila]MCH6172397.1 cytochrome P450 [Pseudonocardia alaniniphila]